MRLLLLPLLLTITATSAIAATSAVPVPGTVKACLPLAQIRGTKVVDGQTIDFSLRDGSVWRSRLPGGECPQLRFEQAFSYQTAMSQLCKQDVITVLQNMGGLMRGASCGLGEFVAQARPVSGKSTR
jgi:hypothetical protein